MGVKISANSQQKLFLLERDTEETFPSATLPGRESRKSNTER